MSGLHLDAGALIAYERGDKRTRELIRETFQRAEPIQVLPEVVAQVWRGGARQARLARLLAADELEVPSYDAQTAWAVGQLCGASGHPDVVDVHVVLHARVHDQLVLTSDPDDLTAIDPSVRVHAV